MSFILDALKKSEAERQRQAGPTLLEVRVTRARRRYPLWALVVGTLLCINALLLVAFVLHRPASQNSERLAEAPVAADGQRQATAPPPASVSGPTAGAAQAGPSSATAPDTSAAPTASDTVPDLAAAAATTPAAAPPSGEIRNPADDQPALPAGSVQVERAGPGNYANLPTLSELGGKVPALQLDLLDYSDRPNERYALINMHRVREGDVLPEGPRVLAITRDGVALDFRGQDFLLRPGGSAP